MALCVSAWKFYRVFREAGIYSPNVSSVRVYKEVSPLEFLCEAEDVALLSDQCNACNRTPSRSQPGEDQHDFVRPQAAVTFSEFDDAKLDIDLPTRTDHIVSRV